MIERIMHLVITQQRLFIAVIVQTP